jgi:anti-sigma B factor antagonist
MEQQVSFQVYDEPGAPRLAVRGELDLVSVPAFVEQAQALIPEAGGTLVIDFSGVEFCDSTGIRGLLTIRNAALRANCELRLTGVVNKHVRWVLHTTALDTVIPVDEPFAE